jgi:hypothetical protein
MIKLIAEDKEVPNMNVVCFKCNTMGHYAPHCPYKNKNNGMADGIGRPEEGGGIINELDNFINMHNENGQ